ncbi:FUSC family membrane protein [Flammeovirga sp. EKP202]|uniref:FUSC family protein n=1 Tax=Flammeovirga sp. EKP202 TaxID=2770592 RepID=UPI00165F6465|nr:FUSC family membrane protein [Flammeovirga sp. EKP202]MBD0404281.1 FUSC family protein [Flammeovirga sp. EKP202]
MDQISSFFRSNQFSNGLRLTWSILFPLLLGLLTNTSSIATAVSIGALTVGLSDSPGNWNEKAKGLIGGAFLNTICALGMAFTITWPSVGLVYLGTVSFLAALLSIFGNRSTMIGNSVLISVSLGLGFGLDNRELIPTFIAMLGGGLWYSFNSLLLWQVRPYATIEKLLGENYELMAEYMRTKARLFTNPNSKENERKLFAIQTQIEHKQEEIRNLLLTQRSALQGATPHGRSLILIMRFSIDIFEKTSATHIKYSSLHEEFKNTLLPYNLEKLFYQLGGNMSILARSIQKREAVEQLLSLDQSFDEVNQLFESLRDQDNRKTPISWFAEVKNILRNFKRIDRLTFEVAEFTDWKKMSDRSHTDGLRLPNFLTKPEQGNLSDNLTLSSGHFRHAIKIAMAMMLGYTSAFFFDLDRGYWIWLSIAVIMKPSFAITKQRMIARIVGTSLGIVIASIIMWVTDNPFLYLIVLIPLGIGTFGTLAKDYRLGMTLLTPFILLLIAINTPTNFEIAIARIIDTALGGIIAYVISFAILPEFEKNKIKLRIVESIRANSDYFREVAIGFTGIKSLNHNNYKLARKRAQLSNANLAMSFQTMLNDPKSNQVPSTDLYEFIATIRMIFSHTATLSANVERLSKKYQYSELELFIDSICNTLEHLALYIQGKSNILEDEDINRFLTTIDNETENLEKIREKELQLGIKESENINKLSDIVIINNQFRRIGENVNCLKQYTYNLQRI